MRRTPTQFLASLSCLAMFAAAGAQDADVDVLDDELLEAPEIRRYSVEVIVFSYAQAVSAGTEQFIPDEILEEPELEELAFEQELEILEEANAEPEEEPEPLPDPELVLLTEEEYQLNDVMEHLTRLDVYEPLMHFGWTQATWPREETEAIPLVLFAEPPEGLDGSLTLYLSRYLHLVVDLELADLDVMVLDIDEVAANDDLTTVGDVLSFMDEQQGSSPLRYRIEENRILKNGELRYYDHPKFGVLAMVTRVEDEEEELESGGELLGYGPE